jgi:Lrp/AsnC family transcriptional regulator for asnA, asnC and gidA
MKQITPQIISMLRKDDRMPLTSMSRKTGIPVSTIFDRIKTFDGNIIRKHTCLIDFGKLGYSTAAKMILKGNRDSRDDLKAFLMKNQNVNSVFRINNGYDFMIETVFHNIRETEEFIDILEERFDVVEKQVYFIIEDVKREAFMEDIVLLKN